jgi:hypothetical protein
MRVFCSQFCLFSKSSFDWIASIPNINFDKFNKQTFLSVVENLSKKPRSQESPQPTKQKTSPLIKDGNNVFFETLKEVGFQFLRERWCVVCGSAVEGRRQLEKKFQTDPSLYSSFKNFLFKYLSNETNLRLSLLPLMLPSSFSNQSSNDRFLFSPFPPSLSHYISQFLNS